MRMLVENERIVEMKNDNHAHEPESMVVAFDRTCKHCGVIIEPEYCDKCNGMAGVSVNGVWFGCETCNGTGAKRWVDEKQ